MKQNRIILSTIVLFLVLTSCFPSYEKGSGVLISTEIDVDDFDKINLSGTGTIYYIQGEEHSLKIVTDDNIIPFLKQNVTGGELILDIDKALINPTKLDFYITSPQISKFVISGTGNIISEKIIETEELKVWISGAAEAKIDLKANKMDIKISGSGDISTAGIVDELELKLSGAGNLDAYNLIAEKAKITISGAGDATVHVVKSLRAKVSGAGNIQYKGTPKVNSNISGAGSVNAIN
ncbi:MAG: DUF2807 domain-containing protein [Bacteroidetes bacterium]|nr:DUF2807 domain-containing protein [Bacteroidota bacterium]MBT6834953.1 DUF2807 domain-containing protein [Bacteroidota bacterium]